ncbi:MAG: ribonuclease H-like domain-containing protein [Acidobacteriia bacterium]|jgi:DEAD/DEAH box helicase domain-containing protein|nr:ribonuclease H-like domain-containing protein [Terriglobia bacterium]
MQAARQAKLFAPRKAPEIYLDVETLRLSHEVVGGWKRICDFGLAVAVTWDEVHGFREWYEEQAPALVRELAATPRIITFNGERFDLQVLSKYANVSPLYPKSLDLMKELEKRLGHRVRLESVARDTLGISKTGSGEDAVHWWRAGNRQKVVEYCRRDVELLRELVAYARSHRHIVLDGKQIPVNWD